MKQLAIGVAGSLIVACVVLIARNLRGRWDRRRVHAWLSRNTKDEPGESHVGTVTIAKGAGLAEDRARHACLSDSRIHRAPGDPDSWSVWRQVQQSVYEKRGIRTLGK